MYIPQKTNCLNNSEVTSSSKDKSLKVPLFPSINITIKYQFHIFPRINQHMILSSALRSDPCKKPSCSFLCWTGQWNHLNLTTSLGHRWEHGLSCRRWSRHNCRVWCWERWTWAFLSLWEHSSSLHRVDQRTFGGGFLECYNSPEEQDIPPSLSEAVLPGDAPVGLV